MQGFDWEALINRTMSAPISINVRSADDASMFDDYDDDDGIVVRYIAFGAFLKVLFRS